MMDPTMVKLHHWEMKVARDSTARIVIYEAVDP